MGGEIFVRRREVGVVKQGEYLVAQAHVSLVQLLLFCFRIDIVG